MAGLTASAESSTQRRKFQLSNSKRRGSTSIKGITSHAVNPNTLQHTQEHRLFHTGGVAGLAHRQR